MKSTISVIVITKNEAHNIEACLQSVSWADEIIVVDSGSTDNTVSIAKQFTDKVYETDWPGFGAQKQRALTLATKEWVLSIDADERVTEKLRDEILATLPVTDCAGFIIPFQSEYCNKTIRFGDWSNDKQLVLFQRNKGQFVSLLVHERIEVQGKIGKLKYPIHHRAFLNLEMVLKKMNDYSTMSARQKHLNGQKGSLWKAITHSLWSFFRGYILRFGFLDGKEGLMLAISNAEGTYYRYLKLMHLNLCSEHETVEIPKAPLKI